MGISQLTYAFAAVAMAAVLSFQFFVGSSIARSQIYKNEILTQVSGVATEILEDIGASAFDNRTREDLFETPPAGAGALTPAASFGGVSAEDCASLCLDIDDFHGLTFREEHGGFDFDVSIAVRYVNPDDPEQSSGTNTFAKEVILRITNSNIYHAGRPDSLMPIEIGRVFTYLQTS